MSASFQTSSLCYQSLSHQKVILKNKPKISLIPYSQALSDGQADKLETFSSIQIDSEVCRS